MKLFNRLAVAFACCAAVLCASAISGASTATYAQPDKAVLTAATGLDGGMSFLNDTVSGSGWISAYYSPTDRWLEGYVDAGATVSLTWHVTGSSGQALASTPVTLGSNLNFSNAHGTTWSAAGLNTNPNGALTQSTDASGNVTFTFTNTNSSPGTRPSSMTTTAGAEQAEGTYAWTRLYLTVGSDVITANPNTTVNQATDLVDLIVVAPGQVVGTQMAKMTVARKNYTYGTSGVTETAIVKNVTSGTVAFTADGTTLCVATVVSGVATCTATTTAVDAGSYTVDARFSGNATYGAETVSTTSTVAPARTTLSVALPITSVSQSSLTTLSMQYSLTSSVGITPVGAVVLSLDGQTIASNAATFQLSSLTTSQMTVGRHTLVATYPGTVNFKPAAVSKTITVTKPLVATTTNYDVTHGALLWSATFTGTAGTGLDSRIWTPEIGQYTGVAPGLANWNYGTGEIETNTSNPANVSYDGLGNLAITAICSSVSQSCGSWTSARISTAGKVNFQYGQIEARIKLPNGSFNWPAFWMLGKNFFPNGSWPNCGEVDIMEGLNNNTVDQSTLHANYPNGGDWNGGGGVTMAAPLTNVSSGVWDGQYHNFGILWTPTSIAFTLDGLVYGTDTYNQASGTITQTIGAQTSTFSIGGQVWPFDQPFFLILQDAIPAGMTAANGAKGAMSVSWIHYYSYNGYGQIS